MLHGTCIDYMGICVFLMAFSRNLYLCWSASNPGNSSPWNLFNKSWNTSHSRVTSRHEYPLFTVKANMDNEYQEVSRTSNHLLRQILDFVEPFPTISFFLLRWWHKRHLESHVYCSWGIRYQGYSSFNDLQ